jgi:hypothetical protein
LIYRRRGCAFWQYLASVSSSLKIRKKDSSNATTKEATAMDLVPSAEAHAPARCKSVDRVNTVDRSRAAVSESSVEVRAEFKVLLPQITTEQLRQRGALRGISGSTLASELLVTVARDSLYDAVLDAG